MNFFKGVGTGIIVGTIIGMNFMPDKKRGKKILGKAMKAVGEVMEDISDAVGF